ncbi:MAG: hypothetical protein MUC68_02245 [Burkholderiaceae bacterium]|nr:hypothetical protein [Burkholderiaceae bacterium]
MKRRSLRILIAPLLLSTCAALSSGVRAQPLDLQRALATASQQPAAAAAVSLAMAERVRSANFDPPPWRILPRAQALALHARVRFYDAVLADLEEAALNERIAIAFIRAEQARERGTLSAAQVVGMDATYRALLARRDAARVAQREARSLLAIAMGQPGRLPAELIEADSPVATLPDAEATGERGPTTLDAVYRAHAAFSARQHAQHAAAAPIVAARRELDAAEARQDEQRDKYQASAGGLDLGDAMADVAIAQLALRRAQYRADVAARAAAALTAVP